VAASDINSGPAMPCVCPGFDIAYSRAAVISADFQVKKEPSFPMMWDFGEWGNVF
jgi:hypothetical protein